MTSRSIHRNIVSTRKIRTSRTSRLFTSPVPPCCIAAGCSPGKENHIRRLTCRFCVPSPHPFESLQAQSRQSSSCPLTNIKFINGSAKVAAGRWDVKGITLEYQKCYGANMTISSTQIGKYINYLFCH